MKKIIVVVLMMLATVSLRPANLIADDIVEGPCYYNESNRDCVKRIVDVFAKKYHVSAVKMFHTLQNENDTFQFDRQSELVYKKNNRWGLKGHEQSYGVAMIHLPDNPGITKEEAINPVFAIEFMAKEFAKGHQKRWMGFEG